MSIKEDAPVNVTGSAIAGTTPNTVGVLPGIKSKIVRRKKLNIEDIQMSKNIFKETYDRLKLNEAKKDQPVQQQSTDPVAVSNSVASELFARCRAVSTTTHFAHLSTDSFSEHQALSTFYTDIIDNIDSFCESYIGKYGKFITLPPIVPQMQLALDAIIELRDWIGQSRNMITDDSSLQNIIDEIVELCNSTIYKLQKLK